MLDKIKRGVGRLRKGIEKARIGNDPRLASKALYEGAWGGQLDAARSFAGEGANLARVLSCMDRSDPDANRELIDRYGFRFLGRRVEGLKDYLYENQLFELTLHLEIARHLEADTVNIVEVGSGYGKNLFRLWLNGGPPLANYLAYEFTGNGRKCSEFLAGLEPAIRFSTHAFDYYAPRLAGFDRQAKTFAFSSYSVEQIPTLGTAVFDELLSIPGLYKVVHVEPVGWQRARETIADPLERGLQEEVELAAREARFNTDFLEVCASLAAAGRIHIDTMKYDFLAHRPNLPGLQTTTVPGRA